VRVRAKRTTRFFTGRTRATAVFAIRPCMIHRLVPMDFADPARPLTAWTIRLSGHRVLRRKPVYKKPLLSGRSVGSRHQRHSYVAPTHCLERDKVSRGRG
jgi:hypothetical protein